MESPLTWLSAGPSASERRSVVDIVEEAPSGLVFKTSKEVDDYIRGGEVVVGPLALGYARYARLQASRA